MKIAYSNTLSVKDYCTLRKSVEWYDIPENIVEQALVKSDFIISAKIGDSTVGMARLMTDGTQLLIMDVVVHPDYQEQGIGKGLMEQIVQHIKSNYSQMIVSLTTDEKNTGFYEKLGFDKIIGMRLWHGIK
jgi:N-acetylglutamate synthase-like GNAT family acetyltransferase